MAIQLHTEERELPVQDTLVVGRHRDEFQLQIDSDVESLKMATAKAGWPDPDPAKLYQRYVVGKDDATAMKGVIRRAGTLHKVAPQFYTDAKTDDGLVVIKFHVNRATDKDGKPVADDSLTDDGKPKPAAASQAPAGGGKGDGKG